MLRVLLFSPSGAGNHYFGPGTSAYRMYRSLSESDNASVSLAHGFKEQEKLDLFEEQFFISEYRKRDLLSGGQFLWSCREWIKKHADRFDVIHCLGLFHYTFIPAVWFEKSGLPVVVKVTINLEGGFSESSVPATLLGLELYRKKNAHKITGYIAISSAIQRMLLNEAIPAEKIHTIPNGVDTGRFLPVDQKKRRDLRLELGIPDKCTVIFTGSFSNRKNPFLAVEAFRLLAARDDVQLLLVGSEREKGNQKERIEEFIRQHRLENVIIRGYAKDIERYYLASDLFILPSVNEGLSNSMLEALSCGLPALVTRISGSEDIIDETLNGSFITENAGMIANTIESYLDDRDKLERHSKGARDTVIREYSSKVVLQKHLEIFNQLAAK